MQDAIVFPIFEDKILHLIDWIKTQKTQDIF